MPHLLSHLKNPQIREAQEGKREAYSIYGDCLSDAGDKGAGDFGM